MQLSFKNLFNLVPEINYIVVANYTVIKQFTEGDIAIQANQVNKMSIQVINKVIKWVIIKVTIKFIKQVTVIFFIHEVIPLKNIFPFFCLSHTYFVCSRDQDLD